MGVHEQFLKEKCFHSQFSGNSKGTIWKGLRERWILTRILKSRKYIVEQREHLTMAMVGTRSQEEKDTGLMAHQKRFNKGMICSAMGRIKTTGEKLLPHLH